VASLESGALRCSVKTNSSVRYTGCRFAPRSWSHLTLISHAPGMFDCIACPAQAVLLLLEGRRLCPPPANRTRTERFPRKSLTILPVSLCGKHQQLSGELRRQLNYLRRSHGVHSELETCLQFFSRAGPLCFSPATALRAVPVRKKLFAWHCLAIIKFAWRIAIGCGAKHVWELCAPALGAASHACLLGCKHQLPRTTRRLFDVHHSPCAR
jgi:hypothetical protein